MTRLDDLLEASTDVRSACQAVVDDLAAVDGLLPSVYLERGGRLRVQALHGYWQAVDGLAPFAGVIGSTFALGRPHLEQDVSRAADYLVAAAGVVAEACHPVRVARRVVGVVNLEARRPLTPDEVTRLADTARALGDRLAALDAAAPESPAQRLVRHAVLIARLREVAEIEAEAIAAALDISSLRSAAVLRVGGHGVPEVVTHAGPLGALLAAAPGHVLKATATYVAGGSSVVTTGLDGAPGAGFAELRAAGVQSLAVLGLPDDSGRNRRILLLADDEPRPRATGELELLELLAAHVAAALRTAADVDRLREEAARDALTGLGHHATFHGSLRTALGREDHALAVLLIDVDGFKAFNDAEGHQAGDSVLRDVAHRLSTGLRSSDRQFRIGGDEFAALVVVEDADGAERAGRRLHRSVGRAATGVTVSIGIAVAGPQETAADLLARADRALYAAKDAGRDRVALADVVA